TFGPSYLGGDQLLLAAEAPPGLVVSFAQVAATDQFRNGWVYMDGVFALNTAAPWTTFMVGDVYSRGPPAEQAALTADCAALGIEDAAAMKAAYQAESPSEARPEVFEKLMKSLPLR